MQSKAVRFKLIFVGLMSSIVSIFGATQSSVVPSEKVKVVSCSRQMVGRQQYQTLLHKLYRMQYNLSKIRTNKKYCLLRSQLGRLLFSLKEKYKRNALNPKRFKHIQKNVDKLDREIHRMMVKTSLSQN